MQLKCSQNVVKMQPKRSSWSTFRLKSFQSCWAAPLYRRKWQFFKVKCSVSVMQLKPKKKKTAPIFCIASLHHHLEFLTVSCPRGTSFHLDHFYSSLFSMENSPTAEKLNQLNKCTFGKIESCTWLLFGWKISSNNFVLQMEL